MNSHSSLRGRFAISKPLLLLFALVLVAGAIRLSVYGLARLRAARPRVLVGPPASTVPPEDPPPGRPFPGRPISYATAPPTRDALRAAVRGRNLVICVLDAARADHFGCYGYPRDTTPSFDRLAKQSLVFLQHFSQIPQTRPSTLSLLTSQYPDTHGLLANVKDQARYDKMDPKAFTLEKALQQTGVETYLLSGNVTASPDMGVGADFMHRDWHARAGFNLQEDSSEFMLNSIAKLPARLKANKSPFFAYIHFLPPHNPYVAPKEIQALFRGRPPRHWESVPDFVEVQHSVSAGIAPASWVDWINAYDANLRWADACLGKLEETLRKAGLLGNTLLVVTADHGEALGEHGYTFHIDCPYDETLHIPLLIRLPGSNPPAGRVHALSQTVDLLPTLLDLYGIPYPRDEVQGKSLVPLLAGEVERVNEAVFSRAGFQAPFYVVRDEHAVLMLYQDGRTRALFDMDADPWQMRNVISDHPDRAAALTQAFGQFARAQKYPPLNFLDPSYQPPTRNLPTAKMSEETKRRLKSLGYLK